MSHQCLAKHAITAYHLPCRAQLQQGLGDHWRLLVVGCHDGRIQSLHSPLAGVLQHCLPHLCHYAQACTWQTQSNSLHDLNTYACQNACHCTCTWHVTAGCSTAGSHSFAVDQEHTQIAGHALLCSTATTLTAYQCLHFLLHTCACKVIGHKPAQRPVAYMPSTKATALSQVRALASAAM